MQTRAKRLVIGTICKRGHPLASEADIKIDGHGVRRCYECTKEDGRRHYHARRKKDPKGTSKLQKEKDRRRRHPTREQEAEVTRGHRPDPDSPRLFDQALDHTRPKCDGDERFTDWETPNMDADDETPMPPPPSPQEARLMCEGCPLFDLCLQASIVKRPYHGVYAGQRFENGRRLPL